MTDCTCKIISKFLIFIINYPLSQIETTCSHMSQD